MSKEAMKLALEAFQKIVEQHGNWNNGIWASNIAAGCIRPIREALAEQPAQQQEPKLPEFYARFEDGLVSVYQRREDATPLLLLRENLPDKQPAHQEPVAVVSGYYGGQCVILPIDPARIFNSNTALYTSPPAQRTWVGLTYEEAKEIYTCIHGYDSSKRIARAIEAKLKEKNQ